MPVTTRNIGLNFAAPTATPLTLAPGSTVTAQLRYNVGPDGLLIPAQTQVTTTKPTTANPATRDSSNRRSPSSSSQNGSPSRQLAQLAPVKAQLSPVDEVALFGQNEEDNATHADSAPQTADHNAPLVTQGQAVAEDGSNVDVDIIAPATLTAANQNIPQTPSLIARAQVAAAAFLYARNNDITFSGPALTSLAA